MKRWKNIKLLKGGKLYFNLEVLKEKINQFYEINKNFYRKIIVMKR